MVRHRAHLLNPLFLIALQDGNYSIYFEGAARWVVRSSVARRKYKAGQRVAGVRGRGSGADSK